jgi:LuxR family maltose regulon positive regulatory protein
MAQRIPYVVEEVLHVPEPSGGPEIAIGSSSWVVWLRDPTTSSFSFRGPSGAFTARKEHRVHGGAYWTAYRRRDGRLRKKYLGKAEKLTLERLNDVVEALAGSDDEAVASPVPDESAVDDAGRGRSDAVAMPGPTAAANVQARENPQRGAHGYPLLLPKLSLPSVRASSVRRPRLSGRVEEGTICKLTLVSAPAGFGKTTLLSVWASDLSSSGSVAWLSLDAADNDPARFWRYFVTAVDGLRPGSGETALALMAPRRRRP